MAEYGSKEVAAAAIKAALTKNREEKTAFNALYISLRII